MELLQIIILFEFIYLEWKTTVGTDTNIVLTGEFNNSRGDWLEANGFFKK